MNSKTLLVVSHTPSPNTRLLADALVNGAEQIAEHNLNIIAKSPFDASAEDVKNCQAIILGTTENLGYMSGALKDFFDRIYYPCLDVTQGLPCALYIRAGHDGTGTRLAVEKIVTGLKWRWVQAPVIFRGDFQNEFIVQAEELGMTIAASLDAGII